MHILFVRAGASGAGELVLIGPVGLVLLLLGAYWRNGSRRLLLMA
jgi:hypothetical protein